MPGKSTLWRYYRWSAPHVAVSTDGALRRQLHLFAVVRRAAASEIPLRQISSRRRNGLNSAIVVRLEGSELFQDQPRPFLRIAAVSTIALFQSVAVLILMALSFIEHVVVFLRLHSALLPLRLRRVRCCLLHLGCWRLEQLISGIVGRLAQVLHLLDIEFGSMLMTLVVPIPTTVAGHFSDRIGVGELQPRCSILVAVVI